MAWNWQHPNWPNFTWKSPLLAKAEARFLLGAGVFLGTAKHLAEDERSGLIVECMSSEALTSSEIEGEILDRDSVQSSICRQLGLSTDRRKVSPAEEGMSEMMVDIYRSHAAPLDHDMLFAWHRMITSGRTDLRDVGRYRTHPEPMRIVSGRIDEAKVHFEAPPSDRVHAEMVEYTKWFHRTAPAGFAPLGALTRAGIAHLYFESIHPFEDGNGRIGRAVAEKVFAQSLGRPSFTAIAATMLARRTEYYAALAAANKRNDITEWLVWFAGAALEAQTRTLHQVEFLIDKTKFLDRLSGMINARQQLALVRMLREGPGGFEGGMSAGKYVVITKTSVATATRDLGELVEVGAVRRTGSNRSARYHLTIPLRPDLRVTIDQTGEIVES